MIDVTNFFCPPLCMRKKFWFAWTPLSGQKMFCRPPTIQYIFHRAPHPLFDPSPPLLIITERFLIDRLSSRNGYDCQQERDNLKHDWEHERENETVHIDVMSNQCSILLSELSKRCFFILWYLGRLQAIVTGYLTKMGYRTGVVLGRVLETASRGPLGFYQSRGGH